MGKDDLFRKRREQKAADLARKKEVRSQGLRYLIVCEGTKTEPNYLRELCADLRLKTASVRVEPQALGSSPSRVVAYAESLYEDDAKLGDPFDKVFCVIDRDTRDDFQPAMKRIRELADNRKPFEAIVSTPCFEYWLLLHFKYTRRSFHTTGDKSICDSVIGELRKIPLFAKYSKGDKQVFGKVKDLTATAIRNAEKAEKDANKTGEANPSTNIYTLVSQLMKLAEDARQR